MGGAKPDYRLNERGKPSSTQRSTLDSCNGWAFCIRGLPSPCSTRHAHGASRKRLSDTLPVQSHLDGAAICMWHRIAVMTTQSGVRQNPRARGCRIQRSRLLLLELVMAARRGVVKQEAACGLRWLA